MQENCAAVLGELYHQSSNRRIKPQAHSHGNAPLSQVQPGDVGASADFTFREEVTDARTYRKQSRFDVLVIRSHSLLCGPYRSQQTPETWTDFQEPPDCKYEVVTPL